MAAGLGFKTFTTGEVLTAADTNGYLMQGILVFATEAARNSAITSPQEGQFAFTKDTNSLWYYTGSAWAASGATGDIEGVTAGVGITGGGTSGTVTITNDMATTITAAGDIVVGTGSGTYDNLPIGTTAQVLTADTTVSPYKVKWATPSSGAYSIIQSGALSTTSVDITSIPQTYKHLQLVMWNTTFAANDGFALQINGLTASNYTRSSYGQNGATSVDGSVINDNGVYYGNGAADPLYTSGFNHWVLDIYDYTNTTGAWAMRGNGTYLNTSSVYSTYQAAYTYLATATAITRVNIKTGGSRTMAGSYILYGVN